MQKINLHTHSTFCDGRFPAEEMVLAAIEKGFTILGFSGHSIHPLNPDFYAPEKSWHILPENLTAYVHEILRLKEKYEPQIKILLGFEADFLEDNTASKKIGNAVPDKAAFAKFSPDYLIGSVHFVTNQKGFYTVDFDPENVQKGLLELYGDKNGKVDYKAAVCEYYEAERKMLERGNFEILGHADLIKKTNPVLHFFDDNESWYKEQLKLTAKAAAKAGVIAEINTGAIARSILKDPYPSQQFLEYFKDEGVPVCISSDAHFTDKIDCAWELAAEYAKKAGYKELTYPIAGQLIYIPL
jgi:histidinol-phosphatase (PHP family)